MGWQGFKSFMYDAFSENGTPSAARVISGWLCVSSMALIWFIARHAMTLEKEAAMLWVSGLPAVIYALAAFTTAPYGVNQLTKMFKKDPVAADPAENGKPGAKG